MSSSLVNEDKPGGKNWTGTDPTLTTLLQRIAELLAPSFLEVKKMTKATNDVMRNVVDREFQAWPRRFATPSCVMFLPENEGGANLTFTWLSGCDGWMHDRSYTYNIYYGDEGSCDVEFDEAENTNDPDDRDDEDEKDTRQDEPVVAPMDVEQLPSRGAEEKVEALTLEDFRQKVRTVEEAQVKNYARWYPGGNPRSAPRSDKEIDAAFPGYEAWLVNNAGDNGFTRWLSAPLVEMKRRGRGGVKFVLPEERPKTFRELLLIIARWAIANDLFRLDNKFKNHLMRPEPFYEFKRGDLTLINRLWKKVEKNKRATDDCDWFIPREMREGSYVFTDVDSMGFDGGMIRWLEVSGGNPKYCFFKEGEEMKVSIG